MKNQDYKKLAGADKDEGDDLGPINKEVEARTQEPAGNIGGHPNEPPAKNQDRDNRKKSKLRPSDRTWWKELTWILAGRR